MSEKVKSSLLLLVENGIFATTNNENEKNKMLEQLINFIEIVKSDLEFVNINEEFDLQKALKKKNCFFTVFTKQTNRSCHTS